MVFISVISVSQRTNKIKKRSSCLSPLSLYHKSVLHAAAYQDHQEMLAGMIVDVLISQTDLEPEKFTSDV